jgi:hypothetical protein
MKPGDPLLRSRVARRRQIIFRFKPCQHKMLSGSLGAWPSLLSLSAAKRLPQLSDSDEFTVRERG